MAAAAARQRGGCARAHGSSGASCSCSSSAASCVSAGRFSATKPHASWRATRSATTTTSLLGSASLPAVPGAQRKCRRATARAGAPVRAPSAAAGAWPARSRRRPAPAAESPSTSAVPSPPPRAQAPLRAWARRARSCGAARSAQRGPGGATTAPGARQVLTPQTSDPSRCPSAAPPRPGPGGSGQLLRTHAGARTCARRRGPAAAAAAAGGGNAAPHTSALERQRLVRAAAVVRVVAAASARHAQLGVSRAGGQPVRAGPAAGRADADAASGGLVAAARRGRPRAAEAHRGHGHRHGRGVGPGSATSQSRQGASCLPASCCVTRLGAGAALAPHGHLSMQRCVRWPGAASQHVTACARSLQQRDLRLSAASQRR